MAKGKSAISKQIAIRAATLAVGMLIGSSSAWGQLESPGKVIYDSGNAYDLSNWVDPDMIEDLRPEQTPEQLKAAVQMALSSFKPTDEAPPTIFPIRPELMKPVTLPGTQIRKNLSTLPQPLFILGTDDYSIEWFQVNREILAQYGAMGLLTQSESKDDWMDMQRLVAPLALFPMNADVLVDQLGAPGYPIMITRAGFFQ